MMNILNLFYKCGMLIEMATKFAPFNYHIFYPVAVTISETCVTLNFVYRMRIEYIILLL